MNTPSEIPTVSEVPTVVSQVETRSSKPFEIPSDEEGVANLIAELESQVISVINGVNSKKTDYASVDVYSLYIKLKKIRFILVTRAFPGPVYLQEAANKVHFLKQVLSEHIKDRIAPTFEHNQAVKEKKVRPNPFRFIKNLFRGRKKTVDFYTDEYEHLTKFSLEKRKRDASFKEIEHLVVEIEELRRKIIKKQNQVDKPDEDNSLDELYDRLTGLESDLYNKQLDLLLLPDNLEDPLKEIPLIEIRKGGDALFKGPRYDLNMPRIAKGAIGEIFVTYDKKIGRDVIIKQILYSQGTVWQTTVARLIAEARTQAKFNSSAEDSGFVPVYDIFKDKQNNVYMVMEYDKEYIDAFNMRKILAEQEDTEDKRKEQRNFLKRFIQTSAQAVDEANKVISHRDVKTSNFLCNAEGSAKLIDFGMASSVIPLDDSYGTPAYLSRDRLYAIPHYSVEDDIYALAAVYFEMLLGFRHLGVAGDFNLISAELALLQSNKPLYDREYHKEKPSLWAQHSDSITNKLKDLGLEADNIQKVIVLFGKAFDIHNPGNDPSVNIEKNSDGPRQIEWASVSDFAKELAELLG